MEQLALIPGLSADCKTRRVTEPIVRAAAISDGCRWWLKRAWGAGPMICWVMCNPSDADAARDDPTMLRVMEFSARAGYGSCVVVNVIPFISSTPEAAIGWMKRAESWMIDGDQPTPEWQLYRRGLEVSCKQIDAATSHIVAWGNNIPPDLSRRWLQDIAEMAGDACDVDGPPVNWLCLGSNANGSPRHPLSRGKSRVPDDFKPARWQP